MNCFSQTTGDEPCDFPEAKQFDFWIGKWDIDQEILQSNGNWLKLDAKTVVSRAWDGCSLIENWEGDVQFFWEGMNKPEQMNGYSIRYYDAVKKKWNIVWYDSRSHRSSLFEGEFENGIGRFYRNSISSQGKDLLTRIIFSDISTSFVKWELSVSEDKGKTWSLLWVMNMHRK